MSKEIEALHDQIFGHVPAKAGTAYERLTAIVLASLGWKGIVHDLTEKPSGKRAEHQLDVTAQDPQGKVGRLIVECKDYAVTVGEGTLNTLVGVMAQIGAGAGAVVTTKGFTQGARDVAVDRDIALIRLRHYDSDKDGKGFITRVEIAIGAQIPTISDVAFEFGEIPKDVGILTFHLTGWDHLRRADGSEAETINEILRAHPDGTSGETEIQTRRFEFQEPRFVEEEEGRQVEVTAMTWKEQWHAVTLEPTVVELHGNPVLVLEQLDQNGNTASGRLVVDEDLNAWDIAPDGSVHERGKLPST